jgi:hypothetical protein
LFAAAIAEQWPVAVEDSNHQNDGRTADCRPPPCETGLNHCDLAQRSEQSMGIDLHLWDAANNAKSMVHSS